MDGPEGDVDMEVDGNAPGTRIDRKTTIGHASPTSRKHQSTNVEQSSPISSDVEPSSQSASSSNASGQLARANVASPLEPGPSEEAKPSSPPTSRAESLYASPHTQASNGSIHPSLKSTSSRKGPGLTFPKVMSSGPASPRTDTTSAAAEDMVGIVSASEVQMYVGELADGGQGKGATGPNERRVSEAHDTIYEQGDRLGIERNDTLRQNGRGRRASSPGRTFRNSVAIPITQQPMNGVPASLSRSLTEQTRSASSSQRSLPPTMSQPQRFKRFVGSLFRSKSVSSATDEDERPMERGTVGSPSSGRQRSPRRTQSMAPVPTPNEVKDPTHPTAEDLATSPSAMSTRSTTHPGSVTPRIRTRSERSTSPPTAPPRTDVEMDLDAERSGEGHSPKRSRSRREPTTNAASGVGWKCRPSSTVDGVVSGLGMS